MIRDDPSITAEWARDVVAYDAETGEFRWRRSNPRRKAGDLAGFEIGGYWAVSLKGRNVRAHRLAFLLVKGRWPAEMVDHINGDRMDNRWSNLREASPAVNAANRHRCNRQNALGVLGVRAQGTKYRAAVMHGYRTVGLGTHDTAEQAGREVAAFKARLLGGGAPL